MGMFDSIYDASLNCPSCGHNLGDNELQTKDGECILGDYTVNEFALANNLVVSGETFEAYGDCNNCKYELDFEFNISLHRTMKVVGLFKELTK